MTDKEPRWLTLFRALSAVPRRSGDRSKIVPWLMDQAVHFHLAAVKDRDDNIRIDVPATPGYEKHPVLVLQGHMDMVCEKVPGSSHDFTRDPLVLVQEGEWLRAEGTSLGADNGIALALALDLATDPAVPHPPLEILITSDEEVGLTGAQNLKPSFLKGRRLLNLDSEEEGVFTVGCAGGRDTDILMPVRREPDGAGNIRCRVSVGGLMGGHSGIDIAKHRANANVLLARFLRGMIKDHPFRLAALTGGSAHNAIPREASCIVTFPKGEGDVWKTEAAIHEATCRSEWGGEKGLRVVLSPLSGDGTGEPAPLTAADTRRIINLLRSLPHGVQAFSALLPGFVETSTNLAIVSLTEKELRILTNQRSSVPSRLAALSDRIAALAELAGAAVRTGNGYPPWPARDQSPLLDEAVKTYRLIHDRDPRVELTHAGLECGIIGGHYPGMDMISLGPDIVGPHSPDERLNVASAGRVRAFLVSLLAAL